MSLVHFHWLLVMTFIPSIVGMLRTWQIKRLNKKKRSGSAPAIFKSPSKRSARRRVWTDTQMKAAVKSGVNNVQSALLRHFNIQVSH